MRLLLRLGQNRAPLDRPSHCCSYSFRRCPLSTRSSPAHWPQGSLPSPHASLSSASYTPRLSSRRKHYRERSRSQYQSRIMASLSSQAFPEDPIDRTSSPYPDPRQLGPKSKILATRTSNFHSTSLRMVTAGSASVNRTCKSNLHLADLRRTQQFKSRLEHESNGSVVCTLADTTMTFAALHPGGVVPQLEHTELENELHEKAHIDYDRVAIVRYLQTLLRFAHAHRLPLPGPQSLRCSPL